MNAAEITARELLLAHARAELDSADCDLTEAARAFAVCTSGASTNERSRFASYASGCLTRAAARLARAAAFEQAAKIGGEP